LNAWPENSSASLGCTWKVACAMPGATVKNLGGSALTELTPAPFIVKSTGKK
jgi:hypothetical protein